MAKQNPETSEGVEGTAKKRAPKPKTLRIEKVVGGLMRVVNSAGGTAPAEFRGWFTDVGRLTTAVDEYNKGK